jgi:NADH-quinone oxidoreductase subunit L
LEKNTAVFAVLAFTAVLTSFYMVRLWKVTFLGEARSKDAEHAHESGCRHDTAADHPGGAFHFWRDRLVRSRPLSEAGRFHRRADPRGPRRGHTTILIVSLAVMTIGGGAALFFYKCGGGLTRWR